MWVGKEERERNYNSSVFLVKAQLRRGSRSGLIFRELLCGGCSALGVIARCRWVQVVDDDEGDESDCGYELCEFH